MIIVSFKITVYKIIKNRHRVQAISTPDCNYWYWQVQNNTTNNSLRGHSYSNSNTNITHHYTL